MRRPIVGCLIGCRHIHICSTSCYCHYNDNIPRCILQRWATGGQASCAVLLCGESNVYTQSVHLSCFNDWFERRLRTDGCSRRRAHVFFPIQLSYPAGIICTWWASAWYGAVAMNTTRQEDTVLASSSSPAKPAIRNPDISLFVVFIIRRRLTFESELSSHSCESMVRDAHCREVGRWE